MSCQAVRKSISAFLDQKLGEEKSSRVTQHLAECRDCAKQHEELLHLRRLLRQTPAKPVPFRLASQLEVLASHERERRLATSIWLHRFTDRTSLFVDNLMRPLAVPFAGGLLSAIALFMMLVPRLSFSHNLRNDVPTILYTEATVEDTSPFGFVSDENEVEVTIDKNGQITELSCAHGEITRELAANVGNYLLFSSFSPATMFGQPMTTKIRLSFRRHAGGRIVVPG